MLRSRKLLSAALMACAALTIGACAPSGGGSQGQASGDDVTITFWSWRTDDVKAYKAIFDVYEKQHPGVKVEHIPYKNDEYNQILATGLSGSDVPDIVMVKNYGQLQSTIASGQIEPLDNVIDLKNFPDTSLDAMKSLDDGKVYGVPFAISTLHLYYNVDLFQKHGVEVPQTWDEFLAACEKLKSAGETPLVVAGADPNVQVPVSVDVFGAAQYGGWDFLEALRAGEKTLEDPAFVQALDTMGMLKEFMPSNPQGISYDDARVLFTDGRAAMITTGSWDLAFFKDQNPDLNVDILPVPVDESWASDKPLTPGFVDGGYALTKNSAQKEAATELLNWMATPEFGELFAKNVKQISAVNGVVPEDELLAKMIKEYNDNGAPYLPAVEFRLEQPWGTTLIGENVQRIWLGEESADEAAKTVWSGVSQWYRAD